MTGMQERVEAARAKFFGQAGKDLAVVLSSPAGQALMEELERRFWDGDLDAPTDHERSKLLGAREVVRFLRECRKYNERTGT